MFRDYDSALKWAAQQMYSVAYDAPSINRMRDKPPVGMVNDILNGLSSIERHNQAANIAAKVLSLNDKACSEYLMVRYFLCDHCDNLMINVLSMMGGAINRRPVQDVVMEYCGRRKSNFRRLRSLLSIKSSRVPEIKNKIFGRMDVIHQRASSLIENELVDAKLIIE